MSRVALACCLVLALTPTTAFADDTHDAEVRALLQKLSDAFNAHDIQAFTALWADDGHLINPRGVQAQGREELARVVGHDMGTLLQGSTSRFTLERTREISPTAIWLDATDQVTNATLPGGQRGPMTLHLSALVMQRDGRWLIVEARPYSFSPAMPGPQARKAPAPR